MGGEQEGREVTKAKGKVEFKKTGLGLGVKATELGTAGEGYSQTRAFKGGSDAFLWKGLIFKDKTNIFN